ncbi:MAG: 3-deoxy-8-phosphooctulonate synthase [Phycisphaerales bacterium]|nr:3-deoxy-8-phosphooctulonate synthase [Phycisphaerales bacterium]
MSKTCRVGGVTIGAGNARPLAVIAGPCMLESKELGLTVGRTARDACIKHGLAYIFKASFDKANRSSMHSARGPGLEKGLAWIGQIRAELGVPATTDVHEIDQAEPAARAVDLLQVPAFLCRQTDLLVAVGRAAAKHGRAVNVKKGQFMSPGEMAGAVKKLREAGCDNIMLTERGTFFGYGRLVNDFIGVADMMELGGAEAVPVCFDCTHSTQHPGQDVGASGGAVTGGRRDRAPTLALAETAIGVHALFIEAHPNPPKAMSDAATQIYLEQLPDVLRRVAAVRGAVAG